MKILSSSHKSSVRTSAVGSIPSLYVMKALLAISVVALHSPHSLPWIGLPGLMVELFFVVTGYFLYHPDLGKVQDRIWKSVKKVIPLILISYPDSTAILCHSYPPCNRESINYILDVD